MVNNSRGREILILVNIHIREEMLVHTHKSIDQAPAPGAPAVVEGGWAAYRQNMPWVFWRGVQHSHALLVRAHLPEMV